MAHFIASQAPETPPASDMPQALAGEAFYAQSYLKGLQPCEQAVLQPLPQVFLATHRLQREAHVASSMALAALARLRSMPVLRGVARCIPAHWQRRVKNWLQA